MDLESILNMNQSPRRRQQQQLANEFPFQVLSPAVFYNTQQLPVNLPSSIDIDQSLCNSLSSLNLSENSHTDGRTFLPQTLDSEYGGVGSPIGGEGFISPFCSNTNFDESFRASNVSNYNQRVYSCVGHSVDPFLRCHYDNHVPLLFNNKELLPGGSPSRFDPRFDFDQRSYLLTKERLYSAQHSGYDNLRSANPPASICKESIHRNSNSFMSKSNNVYGGGGSSNKVQNYQFLSIMPLEDLRGMICIIAKDQNGCKILQSKFETPTKDEIEIVFSEVVGSIADLMKDQFGNYLIQKLVSVCNDDQKALIIRELTESPVEIILVCMSPYGTRAIQKLLENLKSQNQIMVVIRALQLGAANLANDPNGHHVIQYCLLHFDSHMNQPILKQIADNCYKVATDRSGCCVLQACVEHSRGEIRNRLVAEIMTNAIQIAEDPFGNYVLQHMIGLKSPELTELLVRHLQGNFASLSQNKYASNVVEKCLTESGAEISNTIILELIGSPNPSSLLVDPYGNFVIQSALKVSKGIAYDCLRKLISKNFTSMQSNLYGKKILERLEKKRMIHN